MSIQSHYNSDRIWKKTTIRYRNVSYKWIFPSNNVHTFCDYTSPDHNLRLYDSVPVVIFKNKKTFQDIIIHLSRAQKSFLALLINKIFNNGSTLSIAHLYSSNALSFLWQYCHDDNKVLVLMLKYFQPCILVSYHVTHNKNKQSFPAPIFDAI